MPFGNTCPLAREFPALAALFDLSEVVTPGETPEVMECGIDMKIGAMLCFEDMVPRASRELVQDGANVLVSLDQRIGLRRQDDALSASLLSQSRAN